MLAKIDVVIPVFLVVGFGYVAVWQGLFAQSGIDGLMSFAQNFGIPCLLVTPKHPSGYRVLGITRDFRAER